MHDPTEMTCPICNHPDCEDHYDEARWAIATSEGYIPQEQFKNCITISTEIGTGQHTNNLCAFLETNGLDADAQWVVMLDGSQVATQSIDHPLYPGQPGWETELPVEATTE